MPQSNFLLTPIHLQGMLRNLQTDLFVLSYLYIPVIVDVYFVCSFCYDKNLLVFGRISPVYATSGTVFRSWCSFSEKTSINSDISFI